MQGEHPAGAMAVLDPNPFGKPGQRLVLHPPRLLDAASDLAAESDFAASAGDANVQLVALAIYLVVAWRLAHLVRLARDQPDLPASEVFDRIEWQAAWLLAEKAPPKKTPTVREVVRRIAMLGGFLARKGDGEPGVKTLWQGFARVSSFVRGVETMRANHAS